MKKFKVHTTHGNHEYIFECDSINISSAGRLEVIKDHFEIACFQDWLSYIQLFDKKVSFV